MLISFGKDEWLIFVLLGVGILHMLALLLMTRNDYTLTDFPNDKRADLSESPTDFYQEIIARHERVYSEAKVKEGITFTLSAMGTFLGLIIIVSSFMVKSDVKEIQLFAGVLQGVFSFMIFRIHKVESDKFEKVKEELYQEQRHVLIPFRLIQSGHISEAKKEELLIDIIKRLTAK
jgi:hypothetical protein